MATEGEIKTIFDAEAASTMVNELKGSYAAGKTRSYEWRISQLKCILKMVEHHEQEIVEAVFSDLSKPAFEASLFEVLSLSLSNLCLFSCMIFAYIIYHMIVLVRWLWVIRTSCNYPIRAIWWWWPQQDFYDLMVTAVRPISLIW